MHPDQKYRGWDRKDLTPGDVQFAVEHGLDPDHDVEGYPVEQVLDLGHTLTGAAAQESLKRAIACHEALTRWRQAHGRAARVPESKVRLAARVLALGQRGVATRLLRGVSATTYPQDQPGLLPLWLSALQARARSHWQADLSRQELDPLTHLLGAPEGQPWLNRTGPQGWAEGWHLVRWSGLASLAPLLPRDAGLMTLPQRRQKESWATTWGHQAWDWLAQHHADVPAAIVAHYRQLGATWRQVNQAGTVLPLEEQLAVASWLAGALHISHPKDSLLSSVALNDQLWRQAPDLAEGAHQLRQHAQVASGIRAHLLTLVELLPPDATEDARDAVHWRTLPGPTQAGTDPTIKNQLRDQWLHLLTAHPEWTHTRPLPTLTVGDLNHPRDPTLQAAWRQAVDGSLAPTPVARRRLRA